MSKEAMKQALEALGALCLNDYSGYEMGKRDTHLVDTAITAIEEALAQPAPVQPEYCGPLIGCVNHDCDKCKEQSKQEQGEPVAWKATWGGETKVFLYAKPNEHDFDDVTPLYTTPQQRTWVGLAHEEIDYQAKKDDHGVYFALGALWAEAKLKEKNT